MPTRKKLPDLQSWLEQYGNYHAIPWSEWDKQVSTWWADYRAKWHAAASQSHLTWRQRMQRQADRARRFSGVHRTVTRGFDMNIDDQFPTKYVAARDLMGRDVTVTISNVVMETLGEDSKPVVYFQGKQKGLVLNKTNKNTIRDMYGPDTRSWMGQPITLYADRVIFRGQMTDAIRVRHRPPQGGGAAGGYQSPLAGAPGQQAPAPTPAPAPAPQAAPQQSIGEAMNDEIPF